MVALPAGCAMMVILLSIFLDLSRRRSAGFLRAFAFLRAVPGLMQPMMVILFSIFLEGGAPALKVKMPDEFWKQAAQEQKPPAPELIQLGHPELIQLGAPRRICSQNGVAPGDSTASIYHPESPHTFPLPSPRASR